MNCPLETVATHAFISIKPYYLGKLPHSYAVKWSVEICQILSAKRIEKCTKYGPGNCIQTTPVFVDRCVLFQERYVCSHRSSVFGEWLAGTCAKAPEREVGGDRQQNPASSAPWITQAVLKPDSPMMIGEPSVFASTDDAIVRRRC